MTLKRLKYRKYLKDIKIEKNTKTL